ncbi:MAG: winged helix-turn-helix domain-containing protein [Solirubrobacterales bacterium]
MSPTIRIDDDVFEALQEHAEPLVDTPNSVLRRLLGLAQERLAPTADEPRPQGRATPKGGRRRRRRRAGTDGSARARPGSILGNEEYELPLLQVLSEKGGQAPTSEVLDALGERLNGRLTEVDRETLDSGQIRWRNRAQFVRLRLVQRGDMVKDSPRGMWSITKQGEQRAGEK